MKKHDDYIAGPHHFWVYFWFGLVVGAGVGASIGWRIFDSGWPVIVTSIAVSVGTAFTCGRWGDRGWQWVMEKLDWLW